MAMSSLLTPLVMLDGLQQREEELDGHSLEMLVPVQVPTSSEPLMPRISLSEPIMSNIENSHILEE
jgi:hypothetical protein